MITAEDGIFMQDHRLVVLQDQAGKPLSISSTEPEVDITQRAARMLVPIVFSTRPNARGTESRCCGDLLQGRIYIFYGKILGWSSIWLDNILATLRYSRKAGFREVVLGVLRNPGMTRP